jgi:hypothetical protein
MATASRAPLRSCRSEQTGAQLEELVAEAEHGYDVEEILRRRRRGAAGVGSAAATVESVRLEPELKRAAPRGARSHQRVRGDPP